MSEATDDLETLISQVCQADATVEFFGTGSAKFAFIETGFQTGRGKANTFSDALDAAINQKENLDPEWAAAFEKIIHASKESP